MKTLIMVFIILISANFCYASSVKERIAFAETYEYLSLSRGQDVTARAIGKDKTTFKLTYILINRPFVHQMSNDMEFTRTMRQFGFKKVILSNGYSNSWTLDYR